MDATTSLILVLILLGDERALPISQDMAQQLRSEYPDKVEVVLGLPAEERLAHWGVGLRDVLADRHLGQQITGSQPVILLYLEDSETQGDHLASCRLWFQGQSDSFVAIAGGGADPSRDLLAGVGRLLRPVLGGGPAETTPQADLAQMAERGAWQQLVAELSSREQPAVRDCYYGVLAYVRLGSRDGAVAALADMRKAYPGHFLVDAAAALIPPAQADAQAVQELDAPVALPKEPALEAQVRGSYTLTEELVPRQPQQPETPASTESAPSEAVRP